MLYKVQFRPSAALLAVTLQPGERIAVSLGTLVSRDRGIVVRPQIIGDWLFAFVRRYLGQSPLWSEIYHNPTEDSQQLVLGSNIPGDILRLDLKRQDFCVKPEHLLAHTMGIEQTIQWLGFSSWLAGKGLVGLKLSGKGRVFLSAYGQISQQSVSQRFGVEHGYFIAYSSKLRLKVGFPKGLVGSKGAGEGLMTQFLGSGMVYLQSHSRKGLVGYLRSKLY
ncbi:MAG: TIGR00266 family protein [Microcystaceae cyanobacterium]